MAFEAERLNLPLAGDARAARRAELFRESPLAMAERLMLGAAWALMPPRVYGLPALAQMCLTELMAPDYALPDPERALAQPAGLAGIVHELTLPILLAAYRRGLFPFAHIAPLKWWSPPQRSLLFFQGTHIAKRLRRQMRQARYTVTFDRDFEGVIAACAGQRSGRWHLTWITPRIMRAYAEAFDAGHAHSFEVWNEAGALAGGGYGVSIGGMFSTESQFSREANTSKIGFTVLNWHLAKWGYAFNDGKLMTPTCADMGFRDVARREYLARLSDALRLPGNGGRWQVEADVAAVADWQPDLPVSSP
jgi:leucyl/phenylalanyl-tRNA--protein transferase